MDDFGKYVKKNKLGKLLEEFSLKGYNTYNVRSEEHNV